MIMGMLRLRLYYIFVYGPPFSVRLYWTIRPATSSGLPHTPVFFSFPSFIITISVV
jgi:hypothetical protein